MRRLATLLLILCSSTTALADAQGRVTSAGAQERWHSEKLVVVLDPSLDDLGPKAKESIRKGLSAWSHSLENLPSLEFVDGKERGEEAYDGTTRVLATRVLDPAHAGDLAYTRSYAETNSGKIVEADIVFNTNFAFSEQEKPSNCALYDAESVAAHEMGHFFGLGEDPEVGSTMYLITPPCNVAKRHPIERDLQSVSMLYVKSDVEVEVASDSTNPHEKAGCSTTPASKTSGSGIGIVAAIALVSRRRRSSKIFSQPSSASSSTLRNSRP